jgi:alanine racemase
MDCFNSYAKINLDALKENITAIKTYTNTPVMAVIKADAYGHGAVEFAKVLESKVAFFGVATLAEALELRESGVRKPILMLGHTPAVLFPQVVKHGIRATISSYEDAAALSAEAVRQGVTAPFHFAVDTGMSRIGFQVTEADADLCKKIVLLPNLQVEGLFTHFSNADDDDQAKTEGQKALYEKFVEMLRLRGVNIPIRHTENSAALINFTDHCDMVRAGIILYGSYPSDEVQKANVPLKPVLSWYARVTHVKALEAGRTVGYGATYTVTKPCMVATVSVGYADGYRRLLSNKGHVLIRGKAAPILGRVCMDQIVVDVTDIPGVCSGDPVTLIGKDGDLEITADQMAQWADTISYEIFCGISRRVPRVYVENGETVSVKEFV